MEKVGWLVLDDLLREGLAFYTSGVGRGRPVPAGRKPNGLKRLREREPW